MTRTPKISLIIAPASSAGLPDRSFFLGRQGGRKDTSWREEVARVEFSWRKPILPENSERSTAATVAAPPAPPARSPGRRLSRNLGQRPKKVDLQRPRKLRVVHAGVAGARVSRRRGEPGRIVVGPDVAAHAVAVDPDVVARRSAIRAASRQGIREIGGAESRLEVGIVGLDRRSGILAADAWLARRQHVVPERHGVVARRARELCRAQAGYCLGARHLRAVRRR